MSLQKRAPATFQPLSTDYAAWLRECERITMERVEKARVAGLDPALAAKRASSRASMQRARLKLTRVEATPQ